MNGYTMNFSSKDSSSGYTALHYAAMNSADDHTDVPSGIQRHIAWNVAPDGPEVANFNANLKGQFENKLIQTIRKNSFNADDSTILFDSLSEDQHGHKLVVSRSPMLDVLWENKVDLDRATDRGRTALMLACRNGNEQATKWLVEHGARRDLVEHSCAGTGEGSFAGVGSRAGVPSVKGKASSDVLPGWLDNPKTDKGRLIHNRGVAYGFTAKSWAEKKSEWNLVRYLEDIGRAESRCDWKPGQFTVANLKTKTVI